MENLIPEETLRMIVKAACVENYGARGYERKGDENLMKNVLDNTGFSRSTELTTSEYGKLKTTALVLIPLSDTRIKDLPRNVSRKDVAVCVAFQGLNTDVTNRDAILKAVVVMDEKNANTFIEHSKQTPEIVYNLIRHVNGGVLKNYQGHPMKIHTGSELEVLSNEMVGGKVKQKSKSRPFKPGFEPNPLF